MADATHEALTAAHAATGPAYLEVAATLDAVLQESTRALWRGHLVQMADAGWHTWEAADAYLACSRAVCDACGEHALVRFGALGQLLCQYSHEPARAWFEAIAALIDTRREGHLDAVETSLRAVAERYAQASGLICDFLATTCTVAARQAPQGMAPWHELVTDAVRSDRAHLAMLLVHSGTMPGVDWAEVRRATGASIYTTLAYLSRLEALDAAFGPAVVSTLARVVERFAEEGITPFLDGLLEGCADYSPSVVIGLLDNVARMPGLTAGLTLVQSAARLPLDRPQLVSLWVEGALREPGEAALTAWLALESARSTDLLTQLRGEVYLADYQRVLQLYCEGMTGTRLRVSVAEADTPGLPRTRGTEILFPERVGRYPQEADNQRWLMGALTHQLGLFEFGTSALAEDELGAWFTSFPNPALARSIFIVVETGRVDWQLSARYRGFAVQLSWLAAEAMTERPRPKVLGETGALMEALACFSLGAEVGALDLPVDLAAPASELQEALEPLGQAGATARDSIAVTEYCYAIVAPWCRGQAGSYLPRPISFRGTYDPAQLALTVRMMELEERLEDIIDGDELASLSSLINPKNAEIEELTEGDLQDAMGEFLTELEDAVADGSTTEEQAQDALDNFRSLMQEEPPERRDGTAHYYDEWDAVIGDYRRRWCTLFEIRDLEEDAGYVEDTIAEHAAVAANVRRQLRMLRPEKLRKVKGVDEGEELDLERTVEAVTDLKSGRTPSDHIYVQRQRKERDVAALFLIDMSASTDDRIPNPDEEVIAAPDPDEYRDEVLDAYYRKLDERDSARKRIIDVEKQAVVLMANALEGLGDNYAVCGFSGYGRDRVEYFLCKDFDEPYSYAAKGRLGGIKPARSTRMGPPIRHATKALTSTESRVKALIIISDGYPQDFDYGHDRNDRSYGIADTTKALAEARQRGISTFCLTVDQSGHDYLREMCPDHQYMVIQEIHELPTQLSKVYQSLTT